VAPDGSKEVFIATLWYQDDSGSVWQWQGQGSSKGSLRLWLAARASTSLRQ